MIDNDEVKSTLAAIASSQQFVTPVDALVRRIDGLRCEAAAGQHTWTIDEPISFGGTNLGPDPAQIFLASLGASLVVTISAYSLANDIPIESIAVRLSGEIDIRGFFALDNTTRAGLDNIQVKIDLESQASNEVLNDLIDRVRRSCPILDNVVAESPVYLQIEIS